jgi:hypothetical protein
MKSIVIALIVCIPILALVAAAHLYPERIHAAIYLMEWEYKMTSEGAKAPELIGDIRCSAAGTCPAESAAFTALLRQRFPAGTPERQMRAVLIDQKFIEAGVNGAEYDWPSFPCINSVRVAWRSNTTYEMGEYTQKISAIGGTYTLRCP